MGVPAAGAAFLISYSFARYQSITFPQLGIFGRDVHKIGAPIRAEMGGLAVLVAVAFGSSLFWVLDSDLGGTPVLFTAAAISIVLAGLVGMADDMVEISQKVKPFLIVGASIPLVLVLWGRAYVSVPLLGAVHLGLLYPLVAVPLAMTTSANFSNLLAGFNGLEAGTAAISIGTLSVIADIAGHPAIAVLGTIIALSFTGFLLLNWYPAKIFPGDTGTLMAGAGLAAMGLASGAEFEAVVLSIPAAMDFSLKMLSRTPFKQRRLHGNTIVLPDGTLQPAPYPAVVHAFMRVSPINERGLVVSVLVLQAIFAVLAVSLALIFR